MYTPRVYLRRPDRSLKQGKRLSFRIIYFDKILIYRTFSRKIYIRIRRLDTRDTDTPYFIPGIRVCLLTGKTIFDDGTAYETLTSDYARPKQTCQRWNWASIISTNTHRLSLLVFPSLVGMLGK